MGKKTLIVHNTMSGNARKVDAEWVRSAYAKGDAVTTVSLTEAGQDYDVEGFDKLVVCGGDGTVNVAVNKCKDRDVEIYCYPSGTLNERAKASGEKERVTKMGSVNGDLFTYVCATGAFTEIGYSAHCADKQRLKKGAYIGKILSAYKPYAIEGRITADRTYAGVYSLIMVIDADRCFGFRFNRAYDKAGDKLFFLLIKNRGQGLLGKIRIFFPFFRTFFIGFNGEYHSKNIDFFPAERGEIVLKEEQVFCVDGERREPGKLLRIEKKEIVPTLYVL